MSSFQQIRELRKAGNLEGAYQMARESLARDPSIWNKRAMSWVLYDFLKITERDKQAEEALRYIDEIVALELGSEETLFWEKIPWPIGKWIYNLPEGFLAYSWLGRLFDLLKKTPVNTAGDGNSFLFRAFLKKGKHWERFPDFVDWWGMDNFQPQDYTPSTLSNGKRGVSIMEQVLIAYSKHLLGEAGTGSPFQNPKDARLENFVSVLQRIGTEYPDFRYVPYYLTRLLVACQRGHEALYAFLPFARQRSGEYWVWELLADLSQSDTSLQFACICKALCCRIEDKYSVKLRRKVVPLLLERGETAHAAAQVQLLKAIYDRESWKIPEEVLLWWLSPWAKEHHSETVDAAFFKAKASEAEPLLYADIPESVILVGSVSQERRIVFFISAEGQHGSFLCRSGMSLPKAGAAFRARMTETNGRTRALNLHQIPDKEVPETLRKHFSGNLKLSSGQPFGFVGDIFVPPDMVAANALLHGQPLNGTAIRTWDRNKSRLGWRAETLDISSNV